MSRVTVDTSNCDREPIHIPGTIQPHGALLVLRNSDRLIQQASDSVHALLGVELDRVLGRPLAAAIGEAPAAAVDRLLDGPRADASPLHLTAGGRRLRGIVHREDAITLLELEPAPEAAFGATHDQLLAALAGVQSASSVAALCDSLAAEVRRLTGFERVMVYRFHEDGHGEVVSEVVDEGLDPYLGLHYPASDIPRQARALYLRNWLRIIPNARYLPSPIVPALRPDTGEPLDLGRTVLRSVSPVHLEYMANMGLRASMSISLVVDGELWGLVSCAHHSGPRYVPWELRTACEVLGRLASRELGALAEREATELREARRGTEEVLAKAMRSGDARFPALLSRPDELLELVQADGAAALEGEELLTCGSVPPRALITALTEWLGDRADETPCATARLPDEFPPAAAHTDVASGLLAIVLPGSPRGWLMWFRSEIVRTVRWGGDPNKPAQVDPSLRLHPRRSFEQWKEEVRGRAREWSASDLEAARALRRTAIEVELVHQVEREQRAVRARDDLVAAVSHDLKNPLGVISIEARRLVRRATGDPIWRSGDRIRRSADRMSTLVGDLLESAKLESGRDVLELSRADARELVDEALGILRPLAEAKRIVIDEDWTDEPQRLDVNVDTHRIFRVFSNIIGNAIKFTPEGGSITVSGQRSGGELVLTIADTGPGIPGDQLHHVFDRFWQARRTRALGTGLGLPIARAIVEAHGGRIWAESDPGRGARFRFTLPLA